jgi:hypothetical protein
MPAAAFTAADIKRALKATRAAGLTVAGVDFPPQGGFRILTGPPAEVAPPPPPPATADPAANEWDVALAS